jgi:predicted DCC family thiol-disulfide oxidoreductase YuxK
MPSGRDAVTATAVPVFVYDGDCGFCRGWVERWRRRTTDRVVYAPFQEVADRFPAIVREAFRAQAHLIEPDGRVSRGAQAVFHALSYAPRGGWLLSAYRYVPGFAAVSEAVYRWVAGHRQFLTRIARWWPEIGGRTPSRTVVRRLFLWALALVYLNAFLSLLVQVRGLVGERGILPVTEWLDYVHLRIPDENRFWLLPTLFWIDSSDAALVAACGGGAALALLLVLEVAPALLLALMWATYLSLAGVGQVFLGYQWDALLLETGLLSVLFAPCTWRRGAARSAPVPTGALWLLRLLLFRLTLGSGLVKLLSGDPTWRTLTALRFHYETQPLPTWMGWYAHHLPGIVHTISAAMTFSVELLAPFFIFGPPRLRRAAFVAIVGLQMAIALTGNYGFFNLLTIALCLLVLDDDDLPPWIRRRFHSAEPPLPRPARARWIRVPAAMVLALLGFVTFLDGVRLRLPWPRAVRALQRALDPLASVNSYGLFAVMTTSRPEILIEGSRDGHLWLPYEFRWKPGDLQRAPAFVAPHQPRLDWQMWFAALGSCAENPWLGRFLLRLRDGSPPVRRLLAHDPFPDAAPPFVRAVLFDYRFTTHAERRASGTWWRREPMGLYCDGE